MKEKIYTIPVTDAFRQDCECPMCLLDRDLEERYINDILNHSVMDTHTRLETNKYGFCRMHHEKMYSKQFNRLQHGLLLDSCLHDQNSMLARQCEAFLNKREDKPDPVLTKLLPSKNKRPDS